MTGAMYAAVSGLKAHMQGLNVIGNNVANVNTNGYKCGRYVFQTALYSSVNGGSNGSQTVGGRNPSQIGYGATVGSIDINIDTNTFVPTGKPMDCMIDGDGFFLLGATKDMTFESADDFKSLILTRVGDFDFKADETLSNRAGDVVYGFQCVGTTEDGTPVVNNELTPITKPKIIYVREQVMEYDTTGNQVAAKDPDGNPVTVEKAVVVYTPQQLMKMQDATIGSGTDLQYPEDANAELHALADIAAATDFFNELEFVQFDSISIDEKTGKVSGTTKDTDEFVNIGFIAIGNVTNPNGVTQLTGTYYQCGDGAGQMSIAVLGGGAEEIYDSELLTGGIGANGRWSATLTDTSGAVTGTVEKGMTHVGGSTVPDPQNPAQTIPADESMRISTGGTTGLMTNGLEQGNTDLATEISNMIFMQRGYQANTRIVTVTDSMLEELVNMKR